MKLRISGKVQGVFFRAGALEEAKELGVTGWIKNNPDGTVELHAEGPEAALEQFIEWCHDGPRGAQVKAIEATPESEQGFLSFDIRH